MTDGHRYDLVFDFFPQLLRVQCKWASLHGNVVGIRAYSCRRVRDGQVMRSYSPDEIDTVGAYCLGLDRCFYVPIELLGARRTIHLRVGPTRNQQRSGINWADDFAFERLAFDAPGAVAQLGERLDGIQEARGSSPLGSTR